MPWVIRRFASVARYITDCIHNARYIDARAMMTETSGVL